MRRLICLVGAMAACFACVSPASAAIVSTGFLSFGDGSGGAFSLKASNGYSIGVSGFGGRVSVGVGGRHGAASYTVRGRTSPDRIVARIGSRGRVDVRFEQTEGYRLTRPPKRCEGPPRVKRFGVFIGTILFRGERGYTRVDEARARGTSYVESRWKCRRRHHGKVVPKPESGGGEGEQPTALEVETRDHRIVFYAFGAPPGEGGQTLFLAQIQEHRKRMDVSRFAFVPGPAKDFEFDEGLTSATVRPPEPFRGSATFTHGAKDSTRWTGTLRVDLPGAPHLALTGDRFKAVLEQPPFARPLRALGGRVGTGP